MNKWVPVVVLLLLVGGCMRACGIGDDDAADDRPTVTYDVDDEPDPDFSGQRACRKFFAVLDEANVSTDAQIIAGMQDVWDSAKYADTDAVRLHAEQAVSAAVRDGSGFAEAADELTDACRSIGVDP